MRPWLSILVGAGVVALVAVVTFKSAGPKPVTSIGDAGIADAAVLNLDGASAGDASDGREAGLFLSDLQQPGVADAPDSGIGYRMPDGTAVPGLPEKTPKSVRFGVVLVQFQGAQGAAASARPKEAARELAVRLAADAKTDFHGAVQRGDSGSADDLGKIPRGVLEPAPEYVLFTLAPGTVSDPIETPRGYWIVKRIE